MVIIREVWIVTLAAIGFLEWFVERRGVGEVCRRIVASEARLVRCLSEKLWIFALVGRMANEAIFGAGMLHFGSISLARKRSMAIQTEGCVGCFEQLFIIRAVNFVAFAALAVHNRLVHHFRAVTGDDIGVAVRAEFRGAVFEQAREGGGVRGVTVVAAALFNRRVRYFLLGRVSLI